MNNSYWSFLSSERTWCDLWSQSIKWRFIQEPKFGKVIFKQKEYSKLLSMPQWRKIWFSFRFVIAQIVRYIQVHYESKWEILPDWGLTKRKNNYGMLLNIFLYKCMNNNTTYSQWIDWTRESFGRGNENAFRTNSFWVK